MSSSSSFIVRFPCYAQVGRLPPIKLLQLVLSSAHSFFSPRDLRSIVFLRLHVLRTHSFHDLILHAWGSGALLLRPDALPDTNPPLFRAWDRLSGVLDCAPLRQRSNDMQCYWYCHCPPPTPPMSLRFSRELLELATLKFLTWWFCTECTSRPEMTSLSTSTQPHYPKITVVCRFFNQLQFAVSR